jgi:3-isopropylmalate/(R)-2-methylmalate dehydratase small subunit
MIGLACVSMAPEDIQALMMAVDWDPAVQVSVNIETGVATAAGQSWRIDLPAHTKDALTSGQWDGAGLLLENYDEVDAVGASLPYSF